MHGISLWMRVCANCQLFWRVAATSTPASSPNSSPPFKCGCRTVRSALPLNSCPLSFKLVLIFKKKKFFFRFSKKFFKNQKIYFSKIENNLFSSPQVLLRQSHRLRALDLLGRFVDLGPWAVNQAL